eukprot:1294707-Pleurochrysis_carterae.AAC.1
MLAFAMSHAAGKKEPFPKATHAEISSRFAAREKLEPCGFCLRRVCSLARGVGVNTVGLRWPVVTVVGARASRTDVRMNQRVGRGRRK